LAFFTDNSSGNSQERVTITRDGHVGIGEDNPTSKLQVEGTFAVRSSSSSIFNDTNNAENVRMFVSGTHFNADGIDKDFRVNSSGNDYMLFVDGGANSVRVATVDTGIPASLEIKNIDNKSAVSQLSASYISGTNQYAKYAEGVEAYNTTSSGTILTIPITDQGNLWHQYIVEFMFCSAEYNSHSSAKAGTLKIGFTSLNGGPVAIAELEKTGNVDSVSGNDSNLLITFTSGYTSGLNNYEGVICHYRVLGYSPEYLQMWNGTLN
jgi:hypothetical protein